MSRELHDLDVTKLQMNTWIGFKVEVEDEDETIIRVDMVNKVFNSQMTEVF